MFDPWQENIIWVGTCEKERKMSATGVPSVQKQKHEQVCFRVPQKGDSVTVNGMRRRPELNGARGEIVSNSMDECGRVTVRVFDAQAGPRNMMIQPSRLALVTGPHSSSMPQLTGKAAGSQASASTVVSRAGSKGSIGSRRLGSSLSVGGRSVASQRVEYKPYPSEDELGVTISSTGHLHKTGFGGKYGEVCPPPTSKVGCLPRELEGPFALPSRFIYDD
eukprot:gnl/TRDRNA2_/TRDRNA2_189554_c0_seq1.p1 gnl/TRDRNA2_/TRDRNA2_189554_c0~~gnl/TRDRNA2_/TRDRNA2_189554_c0_seq1.p1  ORF type:complete len:220 (+),score=34.36 gnl/TRDRNA2_/TRDRNA2_189554_c0_seq1:88-747(+)